MALLAEEAMKGGLIRDAEGRLVTRSDAPVTNIAVANSVAPAANATLADGGAAAVGGDYEIFVQISCSGVLAAGKAVTVKHRNAANSANIRTLGGCPAGAAVAFTIPRYALALNERITITVDAVAFAASELVQVVLIYRQVA